jgi:hypothetical protein
VLPACPAQLRRGHRPCARACPETRPTPRRCRRLRRGFPRRSQDRCGARALQGPSAKAGEKLNLTIIQWVGQDEERGCPRSVPFAGPRRRPRLRSPILCSTFGTSCSSDGNCHFQVRILPPQPHSSVILARRETFAEKSRHSVRWPVRLRLWRLLIPIFGPKSASFVGQSQFEIFQFPFLHPEVDQRLVCH